MIYYTDKTEMAKDIIEIVAKFYNVPIERVVNKGRCGLIPLTRQISSWLIKKKIMGLSLRQISELYGYAYMRRDGKCDHSAIIHNVNMIEGYMKVNDPIADDVKKLILLL